MIDAVFFFPCSSLVVAGAELPPKAKGPIGFDQIRSDFSVFHFWPFTSAVWNPRSCNQA
jgi:hypothetical protein